MDKNNFPNFTQMVAKTRNERSWVPWFPSILFILLYIISAKEKLLLSQLYINEKKILGIYSLFVVFNFIYTYMGRFTVCFKACYFRKKYKIIKNAIISETNWKKTKTSRGSGWEQGKYEICSERRKPWTLTTTACFSNPNLFLLLLW